MPNHVRLAVRISDTEWGDLSAQVDRLRAAWEKRSPGTVKDAHVLRAALTRGLKELAGDETKRKEKA